jgi:hypothetical protein
LGQDRGQDVFARSSLDQRAVDLGGHVGASPTGLKPGRRGSRPRTGADRTPDPITQVRARESD